MLKEGEMVALTACSDLLPRTAEAQIQELCGCLEALGLIPAAGPHLFGEKPLEKSGREKAEILNRCYRDERIRALFDVSGGNGANEILPWLDFEAVKKHPKPFWGYSDCTVILNAVYTKTGNSGVLWQVRNLVRDAGALQRERFGRWMDGKEDLFSVNWRFCRGHSMEGILLGGNLRCFLKLAGTPYFPDLDGKLLFLESLGGGPELIASLLAQLSQLGVFQKSAGLLLGTFTELSKNPANPDVGTLLSRCGLPSGLPVAAASEVGHGGASRALVIGGRYIIEEKPV